MARKAPKYALLSVFDKTGIVEFAKILASLDYQIISTGGTAKILTENGVPVIPIQEITKNPESFDGRIKTISFQIEGGILFDRGNKEHLRQAQQLNIKPIDVVVCNLYPFEQKNSVENIDVGGPTMIRAAAKNFEHVLVVIDPKDYKQVGEKLRKKTISERFRKQLAAKAFAHLSLYDSQIARFLNTAELFPNELTIPGRKTLELRYGENPHQQAALYLEPNSKSPFRFLQKLWGRDLSLTNLTDINAGFATVGLFSEPAAAIIKHNSPCGIALGKNAQEALKRAIAADPESAFGGVVVLNSELNLKAAQIIGAFKDERKANIDIVTCPDITKEALELLQKVRKSMGIYTFDKFKVNPDSIGTKLKVMNYKWIDGGFVVQTTDDKIEKSFKDWQVVTKKKPTKKQLEQMQIAWKFILRIRSNAVIVVDKNLPMTRGIGSGQTSRVRSTKIALEQAGKYAKGAVLASDSFFPFSDSVELAAKHGIAAIVQQGGSVNDQASIDTANKAGVAMVFTGRRAFWH